MKTLAFALVLFLGVSLSLTSCSKCYECTHEIVIEVNGQQETTTSDPEEVCTADDSEIEDRENNGHTCVAK